MNYRDEWKKKSAENPWRLYGWGIGLFIVYYVLRCNF